MARQGRAPLSSSCDRGPPLRTPWSHGRPLYHFRYRPARLGSPFSSVVEPDSLCALHNPFCNSTLRTVRAPLSFSPNSRARLIARVLFFLTHSCRFFRLGRFISEGRNPRDFLEKIFYSRGKICCFSLFIYLSLSLS